MTKNLIVLLSVFALLSISQADLLRVGDASITSAKNSLTYTKGSGYTIPVTFKDTIFTRSRNVIVSLYSSNMILTERCFQFSSYVCSEWPACQRDGNLYSVNYPHFTAQGNLAHAFTNIDKDYWRLDSNAPTLIATACSAPISGSYGTDSYGILGLGINQNARRNFNSKVAGFAVYYESNAFKLDFTPSLNRRLIVSVRTDASWNIPNIASIAIGTSVNYLSGVKAIFDLNSDTIGLPLALYNTFIPALASYGIYCPQNQYYQPTCTFTQSFPNVFVSPDQNTHITITPQMYALNQKGNQFTLNFRALATNLQNLNYVTQEYANTIILGNTVLGNYFSYFNLNGLLVSLYQ